MLWRFLQMLVVISVIASNIHWQWTTNQMVPMMLGIGLAGALTVFCGWACDLLGWSKRLATAKRDGKRPTILNR
jgi:fluoride ion exporter CrcB/FEX